MPTMADNFKFSLGNIANDPNFDFLNSFLQQEDDDTVLPDFLTDNNSPYTTSTFNCTYVSEDNLHIHPSNKKLSIMSVNIQSLSAKFSELKDFLSQLSLNNSLPDIICLQELWNLKDVSSFNLAGYSQLECKLREKSQGGGVGIYFKSNINYRILEKQSLFMKIFLNLF